MRDLSLTALRYAAGDLDSVDEAAFELQLAEDPQAQDALCEAVRLSVAAAGQPDVKPDPLCQSVVTDRLHPTWLSRLFARRPYRGHPMTWTAAGAMVTIGLIGFTGVFNSPKVVSEPNMSLPVSSFVIVIPAKKEPRDSTTPPVAIGGGDNDSRPNNRPSTFLPEPPKLDPMGLSDG